MGKFVRNTALAAMAAFGIGAAVPAAQADGIAFSFGGDGARFGITTVDGGGWRHHDRDGWRGRHGWDRRGDARREGWRRDDWRGEAPRCSPGRALAKAERLGLRRAWLRDVYRHTIRVSGRRHGERYTVTFARAPHCPVIGF